MTPARSTTRRPVVDTRARIMDALVEVLNTEGITEFSVQRVADRAGVAHRTVYRHYPNREALLEGIAEHLEAPMRAQGLPGIPRTLDDAVEVIDPLFEFFEDHRPLMEAMVIVRLALGTEPARSKERTDAFVELVRREAPHLTAAQTRRHGLGLRAIASSQHWYVLTRRLDLSNAEAAAVTKDSLRALIGEIRRHNTRQRPEVES